MSKILILYYSSYGHISQMADAMAEGARSAGAVADILRVPETAPPELEGARYQGKRVAKFASKLSD